MTQTSFGLDLAGYSTTGSAIAVTVFDGQRNTVTILEKHCFLTEADGDDNLATKARDEVGCLGTLMSLGCLFIDVPIDLQGLPRPNGSEFIWQLTRRPVDRAFSALCPLADRIGSYVARMQNLWQMLGANTSTDPLGSRLFETYPAQSLRLSRRCCEGYKGTCKRLAGEWLGVGEKNEKKQAKNDSLARLMSDLGWTADDGLYVTNDEFDAAICALTGVAAQLRGAELEALIQEKLGSAYPAPKGYVLLKGIPSDVILKRRSSWKF